MNDTKHHAKPIGIFDSGLGGLSILMEIKKRLPNESCLFPADQAFIPYGEKEKSLLVDRVDKIMNFFLQQDVKAVVMACNTATIFTIAEMRERYQIPIIGTVPAIKTIAQMTKTNNVAVLSTYVTTHSEYLENLIKDFAPNIFVNKLSGETLEFLVEKGDLSNPDIEVALKKILAPIMQTNVDVLALGCTHYPFLRENIQRLCGDQLQIVDSGIPIAKRLQSVLTECNALAEMIDKDYYFTTHDVESFRHSAEALMQIRLDNISKVDL